jgi:hypothetical protein
MAETFQRASPAPVPRSFTRNERDQARHRAIAKTMAIPRARVEPTSERLRILKHPSGARFYATGSSEWPLDSFTHRRIRDGDIRIVGQDQPVA